MYTALKAILDDPKKLLCSTKTTLARSSNIEEKQQSLQVMDLRMDDAVEPWGGLTLQKDSEFLELFNYHLWRLRHLPVVFFMLPQWGHSVFQA